MTRARTAEYDAVLRVGVVDVGSNSVRLVVFDGAARSPAYFYNEKVLCGLGKGLAETGRLNPDGKRRAIAALRRFHLLAEQMSIPSLVVVATAAVREAEDGPIFAAQVLAETGLELTVIDGAEEARLSAQGVLLGWPEAAGLVCDIGGNSLELAHIAAGAVGARISLGIGPFRLQSISGGVSKRRDVIDAQLQSAFDSVGCRGARLYLVGGSWRAIARLDMARRGYPLTVLHEYRMQVADVLATLDWIESADPAHLRAQTGASARRMELVPLSAEVLREIIRVFQPAEVDVSAYGIREGLLYEHMPPALRCCDPLIEAARATEQSDARIPGSGAQLFNFLLPIFSDVSPARRRLIHAACLLHDTTWRAHPDYRAEVCFDNATRANLGGLDHPGRVFLGLSLLHLYKNARGAAQFKDLTSLLSDDESRAAETVGKAMRFGAIFSANDPAQAGRFEWDSSAKCLTLYVTPLGENLFGEVAKTRLKALTNALGATSRVRRTPR